MKTFEKVMYPLLIIILVWVVYVSRTHASYFESQLVAEDGLVSWAIFWTLMFASLMCFYRVIILTPFKRGSIFYSMLTLQAVVFFLFALDEVSWFQQVFQYETPAFIGRRHVTGQMNLRQLIIFGTPLNDVVFTLGVKVIATLYFLIFPFFYSRLDIIKNKFNQFAIPLPRYTQVGAYAILALFMLIINSENRHIVFEFCFYWILVLMMYNPINDEIFSRKSLVR